MLHERVIRRPAGRLFKAMYLRFAPGLIILVALMFTDFASVSAQAVSFTPSKETASGLYSSGNYSEALKHYSALSENFPADPLYKYYNGVCMVMLEMNPGISSGLLSDAISGSSQLRTVPADGLFWLGRSYQQSGQFSEAISRFDMFREKASKKEVKNLDVDRYRAECSSGLGALGGIKDAEESPVAEGGIDIDSAAVAAETIVSMGAASKMADEQGRSDIDPDYDALAREALMLQFRADSVIRLADRYRVRLKDLSGSEKLSVEQKILQLEQLGFGYQAEADRKFAQVAGMAGIRASGLQASETIVVNDIDNKNEVVTVKPDSSVIEPASGLAKETGQITVIDDSIPGTTAVAPILAVFSTDWPADIDIQVNPKLPGGLVYRIQVAAFRNQVQPALFKSLGPVYGIKSDKSEITYYFIGLFRAKSEADRALGRVRGQGFNDAFVIAVIDGIKVSLERAASVEPEWNGQTLAEAGGFVQGEPFIAEPAKPQTLVYRVEVKKVTKPLPQAEITNIKNAAGNRPFDIIIAPDKKIVYLIGKFITFESAATYSDLLYRNGMRDARVVAYLGNNEIPIEKAKELFDLYFNKQTL